MLCGHALSIGYNNNLNSLILLSTEPPVVFVLRNPTDYTSSVISLEREVVAFVFVCVYTHAHTQIKQASKGLSFFCRRYRTTFNLIFIKETEEDLNVILLLLSLNKSVKHRGSFIHFICLPSALFNIYIVVVIALAGSSWLQFLFILLG